MHIFVKTAVIIITSSLIGSGLAIADDDRDNHKDSKHRYMKMFKKADTNGDHKVSRDEFLAQASKQFEKIDRNHDGYLDKKDRKKRHSFKEMDRDGNGTVSQEEYKQSKGK